MSDIALAHTVRALAFYSRARRRPRRLMKLTE